ncbi:Isochorismatase-like protein [Stachybotrys elegans]|uniref:Isochorismatase-like protein n=1 Tax=Stachybotrys elegans TaxID=80388 RepID=A0A8K0SEI9_9HYPO|nr:Isochorismatase-like protein [Stachybotrys elegans]
MHISIASLALLGTFAMVEGFTYERLDKDNAALLIVDEQVGLFGFARDEDPVVFKNAMFAHAHLGQLFDLPVVMTTSAENGPNGPLVAEFRQWYPDAPLIQRPGEVNAWDNKDFRNAVIATNKTQMIIGGITTDVCTTLLALSLREAGYQVFANHEASSTVTRIAADHANERMRAAGVQVLSYFAIVAELLRDWRNPPGAEAIFPEFDKYFPTGGMVARAQVAAIRNGTIFPGAGDLPHY